MRPRLLLFLMCALAASAAAQTKAQAQKGEQIALGSRALPREKVEAAYERVWSRYAYVPSDDAVVPAEQIGARKLEGKVIAFAGGRRVILEAEGTKYAVLLREIPTPRIGDRLRLMARPASSPKFSWAPSPEQRVSLAQLDECSVTFDLFVREIRLGRLSPEAAELGENLQAGSLSNVRRGENRSMAERAADRLQKLPEPGSAFPEPPPLVGAESE